MLNNQVLMVTGGTGSFGNCVVKRLIDSDIREIRIFSRDEKKQDDMRKVYNSPKLKFYIGDVRDVGSVRAAIQGVDFLFHAAALKQVPSCEFFPMQALKTNVIGTENVLRSAIDAGVKRVVCLSTDKAVYPINAMGISKAMMEKVMVSTSREVIGTRTVICGTRYGNVMGSRGSVVPLFQEQINQNKPITITDPSMTRFMMTLSDAVELVLFAFEHGRNGAIYVQKSPATTIELLAEAVANYMGKSDYPHTVIGVRHGEKLYEVLLSSEEMTVAEDLGEYFCVSPDNRDLNYEKYMEEGSNRLTKAMHGESYTSHNTSQLSVEETISLLERM